MSRNIDKIPYVSSAKFDRYLTTALSDLLFGQIGAPGKSAGKAQNNIVGSTTAGWNYYDNPQSDYRSNPNAGAGSSGTLLGGVVGAVRDLLAYAHSDIAAKKAYERQEESYNNHFSLSAKVDEANAAGINPMALFGGSNPGATSTPSAPAADTPVGGGMELISTLLNYKLQNKAIDADIAYKKAQTAAQEMQNRYIVRERETNLAIQKENYRKLTADATVAEVTAVWAPSMLESQFKNSVADEALKKANTTLSEERVNAVKQEIKQAEERFPQEIANLKQNYAQMAALAYMYQTGAKNNEQELENLKQTFANLEEQNREIKNRADLHQTEIDTFMARNSKVTEGSDGMIIVTSPDGTITRFDALGLNKTTRHTLDGKKTK